MKDVNEIPIDGIELLMRDNKCLVVKFREKTPCLSSAVLNGGFKMARAIANYQVSEDFSSENPGVFLRRALRGLKVPEPAVGLMTAADVNKFSLKIEEKGGVSVCAIATAGISNAASAGDEIPQNWALGTINVIVLIDARLSKGCMVDGIKTATEAKAMALMDLDVRSRFSGDAASGTTTDAVALACTNEGESLSYAGTGVTLGSLIGKAVRASVKEAVQRQNFPRGRLLAGRLEERGITLKRMGDALLEYSPALRSWSGLKVEELIERTLTDVNVSSLIVAGVRLDEEVDKGLIRGVDGDSNRLAADEILGSAIANYMAGSRGIREFFALRKAKPPSLDGLKPFARGAIEGMLAGIRLKIEGKG